MIQTSLLSAKKNWNDCVENDNVVKDKYKARFVSAKYYIRPLDSHEADYEILLDKLIYIYGEPNYRDNALTNNDGKQIGKYSYWEGSNNGSIVLDYYNDGIYRELAIEYAVSDLNDQLEAIVTMQKYSSEDLEGL